MWKTQKHEVLKQFMMKNLSIGFLKDFFENSFLQIHEIEQIEVLKIFFCLIEPIEERSKGLAPTVFNKFFEEMIFEFVSKQIVTGAATSHQLVERDAAQASDTSTVGRGSSRIASPQAIVDNDLVAWRAV